MHSVNGTGTLHGGGGLKKLTTSSIGPEMGSLFRSEHQLIHFRHKSYDWDDFCLNEDRREEALSFVC